MNSSSEPQPERPPADGPNGSADDDVPVAQDQDDSALRPGGDDEYDDDEYEPL